MTEAEYWLRLEFRLEPEFQGLRERRLRYWWCDGFLPQQYLVDQSPPRILGRVWMCDDQEQDLWGFALFLPKPVRSREEIDWESLLPPQAVTRWMGFDESHKYIEIEPGAAVADFAEGAD